MTSRHPFKAIPAAYLLLRRDNEILMLQRANTGYQDGHYSVIAGHIDGGERGTRAIAREAYEEAGITVIPEDLKFVHVSHRLNRGENDQERIDFFYEAQTWQGDIINMEPQKCSDLSWFPINDLPANTIPYVRLVIEDVLEGIPYSEYESEPLCEYT